MGTSGTLKNALQMYEENGVTVMASDKDLKRFKLCFSLYNPQKTLMKLLSLSVISSSLWAPWTAAQQVPLSMEFSRQEYWSWVQFSHLLVSNSLQPHELQHARPPCSSPTPGDHSNPCPLSWWYHPNISSSVIPFSCPQSFPTSGSFPMCQLSTSRARVLELQLQHQSLQWIPRTDLL